MSDFNLCSICWIVQIPTCMGSVVCSACRMKVLDGTYATETSASSNVKIDMDAMARVSGMLNSEFVGMFTGVPVRIDADLEGNGFYCAVSPELYRQLKEKAQT